MEGLVPVLKISLGILATFLAGYTVILLLFRNSLKRLTLAEQIFLSFPTGVAFITLQMYLVALIGKHWSIANLAAPWACLALIGLTLIFVGRRGALVLSSRKDPFSLVEKALICGIVLQFIYVVFKALALPIEAPDAVAIYAIKAKAFYLKGGIDREILRNVIFEESHRDYPLLLPFAECWMYRAMDSLNDLLVKIIFPLYYLSTLAIFYSVLKKFIRRRGSLLFTFMLSSVPQFAVFGTNGYADLPITCYYTASLLYLFLWMKEKGTPYLLLSSLMSFSAAWTKNEGFMLSLVNILVLTIFLARDRMGFAKKALSLAAYVVPILLLITPWIFLKVTLGLESDIINKSTVTPANMIGNIGRIGPILYEYQKHVFGPKRWNIAWLLVLLVFIVRSRFLFKDESGYIAISIILCLLGYSLVYVISPRDLGWHLSTSASRLILHFLPASMFWVALSTKSELDLF